MSTLERVPFSRKVPGSNYGCSRGLTSPDKVPDELVAVIPDMLGFKPEESIVFVPMRSDLPTARVNIPTARPLTTKAGDVELRIPKLRKGSFFPIILEPRRRIAQALYAVVMDAHVHGISTRSVDDLVEAMGGIGITP